MEHHCSCLNVGSALNVPFPRHLLQNAADRGGGRETRIEMRETQGVGEIIKGDFPQLLCCDCSNC